MKGSDLETKLLEIPLKIKYPSDKPYNTLCCKVDGYVDLKENEHEVEDYGQRSEESRS